VSEFRSFKLYILKRQLLGEVSLQMTPSFISHMVTELEEYLRILDFLKLGEVPPHAHILHHHFYPIT